MEYIKTDQPVKNVSPDLVTRFHGRAKRRRDKLNASIKFPFYRWEILPVNGKYAVVAMQNLGVSD